MNTVCRPYRKQLAHSAVEPASFLREPAGVFLHCFLKGFWYSNGVFFLK